MGNGEVSVEIVFSVDGVKSSGRLSERTRAVIVRLMV